MAGGVLDRDLVLLRREGFGSTAARLFRRVHPNVRPEDRRGLDPSGAPSRGHLHDRRCRKSAQISTQIRTGAWMFFYYFWREALITIYVESKNPPTHPPEYLATYLPAYLPTFISRFTSPNRLTGRKTALPRP